MERSRRLHNFTFPYSLKWGNQRLLRCMNINPNNVDTQSSDSESENGSINRRMESEFKMREKDLKFCPSPAPEVVSVRELNDGDDDIEATREKLILDFQAAVSKMKNAIFTGGSEEEHPPRESCHAPQPHVGGEMISNGKRTLRLRRNGEKKKREKFSLSLSRSEMEEDFMAMTGRRLPRKPTKRPKIVQKKLDTLFPGLWLTEVNADLYKVNEADKKTKKTKQKSKLLRLERDEEIANWV